MDGSRPGDHGPERFDPPPDQGWPDGGAPVVLPGLEDADGLRVSLEEIRRALDGVEIGLAGVRPEPGNEGLDGHGAPRPRTGVHRALMIGIGICLLSGLVALAIAVSHRASTAPSASPPIAAADLALPWPGTTTGLPADMVSAGPGVDAPGIDVVVAPGPDGTVDVCERVYVASPDPTGLRLTMPDLRAAPSLTIGGNLSVSDLTATVDDTAVRVETADRGWIIRGLDGAPVRSVMLRYRLTDALVRQPQSAADRALLLVIPLSAPASLSARAPVVVRGEHAQVREATCPLAPSAERLCGSVADGGWTAHVPAASAVPLVILQVDLLPG